MFMNFVFNLYVSCHFMAEISVKVFSAESQCPFDSQKKKKRFHPQKFSYIW